jgi:hypothetical protein
MIQRLTAEMDSDQPTETSMPKTVDYRRHASTMFQMSTKQALRDIPSYRRHKASGQAIVTLSGEDYYLGSLRVPGVEGRV